MPLNLASPGILVKEVDLTAGRVDPTSDAVGAIVGPFAQGPVNEPVLVTNEQELLDNFGEPASVDKHYEHWLVASSYLAYGGPLQVVRSTDTELRNAWSAGLTTSLAVDSGNSDHANITINSYEDYVNTGYDENVISTASIIARNPGSWANGIKVGVIDSKADQIFSGITNASYPGLAVGYGVTQSLTGRVIVGSGSTSLAEEGAYLKGMITEVSSGKISIKVLSQVSAGNTETLVDYQQGGLNEFKADTVVSISTVTSGTVSGTIAASTATASDWFDTQSITLSNGKTVKWNTLADRPGTSSYASTRGSRFDELSIVVIDDTGSVTGNAQTILEKHLNLSKAKDAEFSVGSSSYWRKYISENSEYIFAGGSADVGVTSTGSYTTTTGFVPSLDYGWDQTATGTDFGGAGSNTLTLQGGTNYNGQSGISTAGALQATVGDLATGYDIFANTEEYEVDFLLMGSGAYSDNDSAALASKVIAVAEGRQDALAFISPGRNTQVTEGSNDAFTVKSDTTITDNVVSWYSSVPSSSYAVFDSGYKYMYDRFGDTFRYVPLNGDIAGTCARNDSTNFPWFSPAGTQRGSILNAVKLAYNPSKLQRDRLYSNRVNPIVFSPGAGIILFGDKTGLAKASAFDRINVRRLFIFLEDAIKAAAKDVMFEFNDALTRNSFVNAVEPFLRDVQAKRGIQEFRLICDESNNTAAIIDSNEFIADIYVKPSRSINFIGLTFVATRSGVSFSEVIGNV
tara:strand:- start:632 stop:2860 length:2229 start_codon:yes stop_codon:yes gene_type:complete